MIGIYKLVSPSGKVYIGQSKDIKRRLKQYKKLKCKKQSALYNSLVKYGYNNFTIEIIKECAVEELNELEELYIRVYKSLTPNGYNLKSGGDCCEYTIEAKNNCKRASIRSYRALIDTYNEPLLLFDKNLNYIKRYSNIEEACMEFGLNAPDIYYASFLLGDSDKV